MKNLVNDIRLSAIVFKEIRKERKHGADGIKVTAQPVKSLPLIRCGGLYSTVEGCVLSNCDKEIDYAAGKMFGNLPYEEQHQMMFSPKNGEFIERANYWRELLRPALSPKQLNKAMREIVHWYIHIKKDLRTIRKPKSIDYPLYPNMPEDSVMSRNNPMHRALIEKMGDDLNVIGTYYEVTESKIAYDFLHSNEQGILVNLKLWFNMSGEDSEYYNKLVTYGKYKKIRASLDGCLNRLFIPDGDLVLTV